MTTHHPRPPRDTRARLQARLAELLDRETRIAAHQRESDRDVPDDWHDRAQYREDDDVVSSLDTMTRQQVDAIRGAIERLDAGTWGLCTGCGTPIDSARLRAQPETDACGRCAT